MDNAIKFYKKGEYIYNEGARIKGCYFLFSGIVKIFQTGVAGKDQIIRFRKEGDIFGFRSVIRNEAACTSVENDVRLYPVLHPQYIFDAHDHPQS